MKTLILPTVTVLVALLAPAGAFATGQTETQRATMSSSARAAKVELAGAGASFPYPVYSKMFDVYNQQMGVKVNYQSIGSSGGIKNIKDKVVDFGASDAYLSDADMASFSAPVVHIPTQRLSSVRKKAVRSEMRPA